MDNYSCILELTISKLKESRYRITGIRRKILEIFLSNTTKAYCVRELCTLLDNSSDVINTMTIYNNINFLCEKNIIREIHIKGKTQYIANVGNTFKFNCTNCNQGFEDIDLKKTLTNKLKECNINKFDISIDRSFCPICKK